MTDDPGKKFKDLSDRFIKAAQEFNEPLDAAPAPKVERGVKMRGKSIDGVQYVRAMDIADLLALNGVLPKAEKALRRSVR